MTPRFVSCAVLSCLALVSCSGGGGNSLPVPATPNNLSAVPYAATTVFLSWSIPWLSVPNQTSSGFAIERRTTGAFIEIARVDLGFVLSSQFPDLISQYFDNTVVPGTTYQYRVRPFIGPAELAYSNIATATTPSTLPGLGAVAPDSGYEVGGQRVTATGSGFDSRGANQVMFDGVLATSVAVIDDESLTCLTPDVTSVGAVGPVDVIVTNQNGSTAPLVDGFTYFAFPPSFAGDVRLDATKPAGSSPSTGPRMCGAGSALYTVWVDERGFDEDLYFARSLDRGATWEPEQRIDRGPVGCATRPEMYCNGSNVYVVWADDRSGIFDVYFNRSTDSGATWLANDVRLNTDAPDGFGSWNPQICGAGDNLYVTFGDDRSTVVRDIYVTRSADAGATWEPEVQVDTGGYPGWSLFPQIACEGDNVWVVWEDYRSSVLGGRADIYVNRSTDGGKSWEPTDTRLDSGLAGMASSSSPRICSAGDAVYVVWEDDRNDPNAIRSDIYLARTDDAGATWQPDVRLDTDLPGAARSVHPELSCSGDEVYVVWQDFRNDPNVAEPLDSDIFATRSINRGVSWSPDERIDRDQGTAPATRPQICNSGGYVYVVWEDFRDALGIPTADIYFSASIDSGESWLGTDERLDGGAAGGAGSFFPQVLCDGANVSVVWQDFRNDSGGGLLNSDIYFNRTSALR